MSLFSQSANKKAITYYRHSAEDKQENSVPLQREFVTELLKKWGVSIIHEESDEGVSGLTAHRPGFQRLFDNWILNSDAPQFDYVVVYDVSRWGRFEDADEAGYYEYQCKQAGKKVIYARQGFPIENQEDMAQVQTVFERIAAFRYSKKLSEDVIRGCLKISGQGYSVGGTAPYGLARMLLSADERKPIRIMKKGEHKSIANERITFIPKNDETTRTVEQIFDLFTYHQYNLSEITDVLNGQGVPSSNGKEWNRNKILHILSNQAYKGTLIYNKTWGRLKKKKRNNPKSNWVVCSNAFQGIVNEITFNLAQERLYWMLPARRNEGLRQIQKTKRSILAEISRLFEGKDLNQNLVNFLPVIFSMKRLSPDNSAYWCFCIPSKLEKYDFALCVSVDAKKSETFHDVFLIPTKEFSLQGILLVSETDDLYNRCLVSKDTVESTVIDLYNKTESVFECDFLQAITESFPTNYQLQPT